MKKITTLLISFLFLIISCRSEDDSEKTTTNDEKIVGTWKVVATKKNGSFTDWNSWNWWYKFEKNGAFSTSDAPDGIAVDSGTYTFIKPDLIKAVGNYDVYDLKIYSYEGSDIMYVDFSYGDPNDFAGEAVLKLKRQ